MEPINYKFLFEKSAGLKIIVDNNFVIVSITDAYLDATETEKNNIVGKSFSEMYATYTLQSLNDILISFNRVLETKLPDYSTVIIQSHILNTASEAGLHILKYWKPSFTPILDDFNEVIYITLELENSISSEIISSQLLAKEKKLKEIEESEKRYNMLLLQSPFAFAILKGKEMVVSLANKTVKTIWGKGENIEGKPLLEILPELKHTQFPDLLNQVFTTGIPFYGNQMHTQLIENGQSREIYFNFISQPYNEVDGSISGVTIIADDITHLAISRKKNIEKEFRYQSLIEESTVAIALYIGPDIRIDYVNDIMLSYWGKNKEEVLNISFNDALPELSDQYFFTHLQTVYQTGITYTGFEEKAALIVAGELQVFYFNYTYKALRDKEEIIYGVHHMAIDVTNEVTTKNKLKESEKRYKSLTIATSSIIWVTNNEGAFFEPQNSWQQYTGQAWPQHQQWGWLDMVHKKDRKKVIHAWKIANAKNSRFCTNGRIWSKHHNCYRYCESVGISFLDERNNIKEWVGNITDIHEQRINIAKIAASEERFRLLVLQAPVAICVLRGENYIIETINSNMAEMWDRKIEAVINKPAFDVLIELKEQGFKQLLDHVFTTGQRYVSKELPITLNRNGQLENLFIKFIYEPLRDASGVITGVMALAHDITEQVLARKAIEDSENKFRLLTNTMPQKINTADALGNVTYYNQKWLDDTGFSFEELKNWGWGKAMLPEDIESTTINWKKSLATGKPFEMEYRLLEKGVYKWNLSRASPLIDEKGNIIMWVGTHTDIQHIKEEQVQKDNFIGKVSHELRTPVAIIKTYIGLLQEILTSKGDLEEAKILSKIGTQLHRLNNLVMGLLDVTKINSGTITINNSTFDFNIMVSEILSELQRISPRNKVIQKYTETGFINSDRERIIQVITNLMTNAIKYSPDGCNIITQTNLVENEIIFSIQDFGAGISAAEQTNIFKQFHRINGPMQHTYPGLGLGLYISAEIILQLKGRIWVNSIEGEGATFYFSLPK